MRTRAWLISIPCVLCFAATLSEAADADGVRFFESYIRPLLVDRCYECHAEGAKKAKGGLRLDSAEGWTRGGESGPAITPGKPEASLLVKAVSYTDSDLRMPPKQRLTDREIKLLEEWVKRGAPHPKDAAGTATKPEPVKPPAIDVAGREHWSFKPINEPAAPKVADESWPASPIDRFILDRLEAAGLRPAKDADLRTLIRRATFDLTGLPPTPEEVTAFLRDCETESAERGAGSAEQRPDALGAYARLIDRLLASPRYGERWGRHWLDVARYADSNGLDENIAHGNAWRYRDYVIASFNSDKPFDRFIIEQIAGDLLTSSGFGVPSSELKGESAHRSAPLNSELETRNALIATGFLALGPKVLAEVDKTKMEMDIIDEQVDTLGRAFLGQTIGCARCHDHKFDPITTADYYALTGIFKSTKTMESFVTIAKWWENPIPTAEDHAAKKAHDEKVAAAKAAIDSHIAAANAELLKRLGDGAKLPAKPEDQYADGEKAELKKLRDELAKIEKAAPQVSSAMGVTEGKPTDLAIHVRGSHLTLGAMSPRRFPQVFGASRPIAADRSGRMELAQWIASKENPLTARVIVNRVWRWHFGRGLVRTTDNFGKLGEAPTHPQLLDWLASRFVEDGWSIKKLHRRIMLSRTYQMSGETSDDATRLDPENRLYSRAPVRRLEAEAIRDAMLFVSGRLELSPAGTGGPAITHVKNREFLFDHTSKDGTTYDALKRSVFLPVVRNHLYDFFELFDFPDSAVSQGDRPTTTVAPQALLAMNSPLVWASAEALANQTLLRDGDDASRVKWLYETLYGRPPGDGEIKRAAGFIERAMQPAAGGDAAAGRKVAWQSLAQVLMVSNEFMYVR